VVEEWTGIEGKKEKSKVRTNNKMYVKGKDHPCTGTEALYRLYGP